MTVKPDLKIQEMKTPEHTFDMAKALCQKHKQTVVVMSGRNHPIMTFAPPFGDMSEVMA